MTIATAAAKNRMPVGSKLNIVTSGFVRIVNIGENNNMVRVFSPIKWLHDFILSVRRLYIESEKHIARYVIVIPFNVYLCKSSGFMHNNINGIADNIDGQKKEVNFIPLSLIAAPARKYIAFSIAIICSTSDNSQKLTPRTISSDTVLILCFKVLTV